MANSSELLQYGMAALKAGDTVKARDVLTQVTELDPRNEVAWLWLSGAVTTDAEKRRCLEQVIAINPQNAAAQRGLAMLPPAALPPITTPIATPDSLPAAALVSAPRTTLVATPAVASSVEKAKPNPSTSRLKTAGDMSTPRKVTPRPKPIPLLWVIGSTLLIFVGFYATMIGLSRQAGSVVLPAAMPSSVSTPIPSLASPTPDLSPKVGMWVFSTYTSEMDDTRTTFVSLDADKGFDSFGRHIVPRLTVQCRDKSLDLLFVIGTEAVTASDRKTPIRMRFDRNSASTYELRSSSDKTAFFFENQLDMIRQIKNHSTLLVQFYPLYGSQTMATFELDGLDEAIKLLEPECPIK